MGMQGRGMPFGSFGMSTGMDGSGPMMMDLGACLQSYKSVRTAMECSQTCVSSCHHHLV